MGCACAVTRQRQAAQKPYISCVPEQWLGSDMDRDVRSQLPHCFSIGNWACGAPNRPGNRLGKRGDIQKTPLFTARVRIEPVTVPFSFQALLRYTISFYVWFLALTAHTSRYTYFMMICFKRISTSYYLSKNRYCRLNSVVFYRHKLNRRCVLKYFWRVDYAKCMCVCFLSNVGHYYSRKKEGCTNCCWLRSSFQSDYDTTL